VPPRTDFLKPEVAARLRSIDLRARLVVEGFLAGLHRSPFKGFSVEFTEHRQYMPGDELKRIDWRVYGRTDRFFIREYEEETNLRACIVLDSSNSMSFRTSGITKLEYASCLAASLAYLLLHQKDSCGLITFSSRIDSFIPPRSTPAHLNVLLGALDKLRPGGDTNVAATLHQLAERVKRRGLIILLSDLWDDESAVVSALRHFRFRKHEVLVFHILDPAERDFGFRQPLVLRDLESGAELTVDPRVVGQEYRRALAERLAQFERRCAEGMIDYHRFTTDTPFDQALFSYLERRRRLH